MPKIREYAIEHLATRIEYDGPPCAQRLQFQAGRLADATADTVSLNGFAKRLGRGKAHGSAARCVEIGFGEAESGEQRAGVTRAVVVHFTEVAGSEEPDTFGKAGVGLAGRRIRIAVARYPDYLSELTVSFLRPCARRRERTARPSAVFMRFRKPCTLARRRLFG